MRNQFPGYYSLSDAELEKLWQECLFVLDANIDPDELLNQVWPIFEEYTKKNGVSWNEANLMFIKRTQFASKLIACFINELVQQWAPKKLKK